MIALRFAQSVLHSRLQAILWAVFFASLPFLAWIAAVVVGLVTLCKGKLEGFIVLLWAQLPVLAMALYTRQWYPAAMMLVFGSILVWLAACLLRQRQRWSEVLYFIAVFGMIGVALFHWVLGDVNAWWLAEFNQRLLPEVGQAVALSTEQQNQLQQFFHWAAPVATGLEIVRIEFSAVLSLLFARALQYLLIQPGRFAFEFKGIRLHWVATLLLLVDLGFAVYGIQICLDWLPVAVLPFIVAGISLVQSWLMKNKKARSALMLFYFLLIFVVFFLPPLLLVFVVLAVLDSLVNFRKGKLTCK